MIQRVGCPRSLWAITALTVLALGALSGPAVAQKIGGGTWTAQPLVSPSITPLRVHFTSLYCIEASDDGWWTLDPGDEPYVVIFAADLRGGGAVGRVFRDFFREVDSGETRNTEKSIWGSNGNGAPIASVNDYIFLVALMEEDDIHNFNAVIEKLPSVLIPKLKSYKAAGMSRSAIAGNLRNDMDRAIEASRDGDDRVGGISELFFSPSQLDQARAGTAVYESREFTGSDSKYRLTFRVQR